MNLITQNIESIKALCKSHKVKSLYAFGSVLSDKFNDESDIDLIVNFSDVQLLDYADNYFDFGFSLGVLHHIPDTARAMQACVEKIKPGGHFLVYLYYKLDNRGRLYRLLFGLSVSREQIRKKAIEIFDLQQGADTYEKVYQQLLK